MPASQGREICIRAKPLIFTGDFERREFFRNEVAGKNFGDAHRVPGIALPQLLSASCCFSSSLSSWLPWIYSPFPFFMESCNGEMLQLIECIESTRSEVKRKMIERKRHHRARKSPECVRAKKIRDTGIEGSNFRSARSSCMRRSDESRALGRDFTRELG